MRSNTKLTKGDKDWFKNSFMKHTPTADFVDNGCVTMCIIPEFENSKMMRVSVSVMSDNETKFRRKVGKYFAAVKMTMGQYITLPKRMDYLEFMDTIAF